MGRNGAFGIINVVNKYAFKGTSSTYIGRPSPLGNPYSIDANNTRDDVIRGYEKYLPNAYLKSEKVRKAIDSLVERYLRGEEINLLCFCAPRRCHGDVIKKFVIGLAEKAA